MDLIKKHVKNVIENHMQKLMKLYETFDDVNLEGLDWKPEDTFVLLVSILEFENSNCHGWDKSNRKCKNLYDVLIQMGVKKENIYYLKEADASASNFKNTLETILKKCKEFDERNNNQKKSNFMFYYAGHGNRKYLENSDDYIPKFCFTNYDNLNNKNPREYSLDFIKETIVDNFDGNMVILSADCCFSGCLSQIAEELYKKNNTKGIVFTSATDTNISTGRWTFTDCLVELLIGMPLSEYSNDFITLSFAADYIRYSMGLVNDQKSFNYFTPNINSKAFKLSENLNKRKDVNNFLRSTSKMIEADINVNFIPQEELMDDELVEELMEKLVLNDKQENEKKNNVNILRLGLIKNYFYNNQNLRVRIIERDDESKKCKVHWYDWDNYGSYYDSWTNDSDNNLSEIKFDVFPIGSEILVFDVFAQKYFPAVVLETEWIFHLIKYENYDNYYNEWVTCKRIKRYE